MLADCDSAQCKQDGALGEGVFQANNMICDTGSTQKSNVPVSIAVCDEKCRTAVQPNGDVCDYYYMVIDVDAIVAAEEASAMTADELNAAKVDPFLPN